jgi:hypothetical protein
VKLFFDNCTSPYLAKGIAALAELSGDEFKHLRDRFPTDTPDPVWLGALGSEGGWIIISGDLRITRNPVDRAAWHASSLTAFFLSAPWAKDSYWTQCAALVQWWPEIMLTARSCQPGCGFIMQKGARKPKPIYASSA